MRSGAVILGITVSAVLLAGASVLYVLANNNSGQRYQQSIDLVRQMQLLSSDWSMEITRVKANPLADFDTLAAFIPRMARFKENLSDTAQRIPDLPDRLASDLQAYLSAIEAKEERIERFKTGYAVVRNSRRYLPLAATNVLQQAQDAQDEDLVRNVSNLIRDVNLYLDRPTETAQSRLASEIGNLREASVAYPPPLANAMANLFSHAEVLVAKQGPTEELFQRATSSDISDLTDQLTGSLEFELGKNALLTSYYDRGMMAVVAVLILFWIALALQQRIRSGPAVAQAAPRPAAAAPVEAPPPSESEPAPAAATVEPELLPAAPAPLPAARAALPANGDPRSALLHGFVVKSVAGILASSADEIAERMDYLRRAQQEIQGALRDSDVVSELSDGTDLDENVESISAVASSVRQRMNGIADLAKRLEAFSNAPANDLDRSMIDINDCVEGAVDAAGAGNDVTIMKNLGDVPEIFASRTELQMVLAELLENSLLAVQGLDGRKGIVKIDTARSNDEILITVIDNGNGITPERRANMFKPFYTSRDGAIGMGLALAGHLVKKYEGVIKINSLPGQGTVARIALPVGITGP